MVRALVWFVLCVPLTAALLAATPALGDVSQSGSVIVNQQQVLVGTSQVQPVTDGVLTVTPPSTLTTGTMLVGAGSGAATVPSGQVSGQVFVTGGAVSVATEATVGATSSGRLEVSQGGTFDAATLNVGGRQITSPVSGGVGDGTAVVSGPGSKIRTRSLRVGPFGVGRLVVENGGTLGPQLSGGQEQATIASGASSIGSVLVDGAGSTWQQTGAIIVGGSGAGSLDVLHGGVVNSASGAIGQGQEAGVGQGAVRIDGPGSRWSTRSLTIGDRAFGEVRVTNGGVLDVGQGEGIRIGGQTGSFGRLVVSGRDTLLQNDASLTINSGEFIIEGGAVVTGSTRNKTTIGASNGQGLVVVRGEGTRWQVAAPSIGTQTGAGELRIEDGGTVALMQGIGQMVINRAGRLVLDGGALAQLAPGTQSSVLSNGLVEGSGRIATDNFSNSGGTVQVHPGDHLRFSGNFLSQQGGRVEVTAGELEVERSLTTSGEGGALFLENATVRVRSQSALNLGESQFVNRIPLYATGGINRVYGRTTNYGSMSFGGESRNTFFDSLANTGRIAVDAGSELTVLGSFAGAGAVGAGHVRLEGAVSAVIPDEPSISHALSFGGDVTLGHLSTLELAAGETSLNPLGGLTALGKVTLGGTLSLSSSFSIEHAASFEIITAGELLGQFDATPDLGSTIGMGVRFNGVTYDYIHDRVLVSLLPALEADFNVDGTADGADLLAWQQGNMEDPAAAAALAVWTNAVSPASTGQAAAVPEPAAALQTLFAGLLLCRRRCRD